jgi:plasmid stability protein
MRMPKMIQIRHVPDPLHRKLKSRAALEGLSLSDYLLREMKRIAEAPTLAELEQRLSRAAPVQPGIPVEQIIREERDAR